jgi:hypothetical protein
MAANPNPQYVTDEMWILWEGCQLIIPGVRLSGIYANKRCYHNTVKANQINYPGAYCVVLSLDLKGPLDKARAIDLTMSDANMRLYTKRLQLSCLNDKDNRLKGMREFFGTLDGVSVYGLSHNSDTGKWVKVTSDASHLWHIHISFFTFYCNNLEQMNGVMSVLSGQSLEDWESGMALTQDDINKVVEGVWGKMMASEGLGLNMTMANWLKGGYFSAKAAETADTTPDDVAIGSVAIIAQAAAQATVDKLVADGWVPGGGTGGGSALTVTLSGTATPSTPTPPTE